MVAFVSLALAGLCAVPAHRSAITSEARRGFRIPSKLFFTGNVSDFTTLPFGLRKNVERTAALNPDLTFHWLGDTECADYIHAHFDDELFRFYKAEVAGIIRGDICRAAVLFHEGGFYVDQDVEMRVPFTSLIEPTTTFMSSTSRNGEVVLNAILAATPHHPIFKSSIELMRKYYRGNLSTIDAHLLGPYVMAIAINSIANVTWVGAKRRVQWRGREELSFLEEKKHKCSPERPSEVCPEERLSAQKAFDGTEYALFGESKTGSIEVVGWSRFSECREFGCGGGGHPSIARRKNDPPRFSLLFAAVQLCASLLGACECLLRH